VQVPNLSLNVTTAARHGLTLPLRSSVLDQHRHPLDHGVGIWVHRSS